MEQYISSLASVLEVRWDGIRGASLLAYRRRGQLWHVRTECKASDDNDDEELISNGQTVQPWVYVVAIPF